MRRFSALDALVHDARYGLRQLRRAPVFTMAAVVTLALSIGANTALFAIANAALLRSLPYPDAGRLVSISMFDKGRDVERLDETTALLALQAPPHPFDSMAIHQGAAATLTGPAEPERIIGADVTARFFDVLRVQPSIGRAFADAEMLKGGPPVVILSDSLWMRAFGRAADITDRSIRLDDRTYAIAGVMPPGFQYPGRAEFWRPHVPGPPIAGGFRYTDVIARLRPDVTADAARASLLSMRSIHETDLPAGVRGSTLRVMTLHERLRGSFRPALALLLAIVACVLILACANLANLLLARASVRRRELAVRASLGASRGRLVRQLLLESMLLACLGAIPGLMLAWLGVRGFVALGPSALSRIPGIGVDATVLIFTLAITVGTGLLFGIAPALAVARRNAGDDLKQGHSWSTERRQGPRQALVILQLAMAVVLTIGAGLLAKSFVRFQAVDRGFDADAVLTGSVNLPRSRYADAGARRAFFDDVLARMRAVSGVETVSMAGGGPESRVFTANWAPPSGGEPIGINVSSPIGRDYFKTYGVPVVAGSECGDGKASAALVNETMARAAFPGRSAVGELLHIPGEGALSVAGVVGNVRSIPTGTPHAPFVYPCADRSRAPFSATIALRARPGVDPASLAPALREAVRTSDPSQPVTSVTTVAQTIAQSITSRWFDAFLIVSFAGLALVLAIFGLYAVIAYLVARRTHEIGVRMALGARGSDVLALVLRHACVLTGAGVALGVAAAVPLGRFIRTLLFDVQVTDAMIFTGVPALLASMAIAAALLPAWRASRVNPVIALRTE